MKKFLPQQWLPLPSARLRLPPISALRPYYNNPPAYAAPICQLTGFYIGGHLGGAFSGSNSFNGLVLNDHNSCLMGGVQAGADWRSSRRTGSSVSKASTPGSAATTSTRVFPGGFFYNNDQRDCLDHWSCRLDLGSRPSLREGRLRSSGQ